MRKLAPGGRSMRLSNQFPLNRVHHRLQPIVGAKLLVDMVQMVAEGLGADAQRARDLAAVPAFREEAQFTGAAVHFCTASGAVAGQTRGLLRAVPSRLCRNRELYPFLELA